MRTLTIYDEVERLKTELFTLKRDCIVRVEGEKPTDEVFWTKTLNYVLPNMKFLVFKTSNYPSENSTGKQNVLQFKDFAARDFILCVDSDYDYLLENPDLQRPFIFQTYVYSVENYQCYVPNLANVLQKRFDTEGVSGFDFEDFMAHYSAIIHRLLVYSLFSMKTDKQFTAFDCGQKARFFQHENIVTDLGNLAVRVDNQCIVYANKFDASLEFQNFEKRIKALGLTETNAYLFFRGHNLLENVVLKLLGTIGKPIKTAEFERRRSLKNGKQAIADYDDFLKQNSFEKLLANHTTFMENPFFQKIESDLLTAFRQN